MTTRRQAIQDWGLAVAVFAASIALLGLGGSDWGGDHVRHLDPAGVVLAALASLPLAARRRAPLAVFVVTACASAVLAARGYAPGPPLGPTVALFFVAAQPSAQQVRQPITAAVVIGLFLVHISASGVGQETFPFVALLFGTVVWGGAWVLGDRVRQRRERLGALEERAVTAEREAERERMLAAAEERTRIARDLHDSVGHALNVILVQAGAARLLQQSDPPRARESLETVEQVARETVGEIDQLVRVLREGVHDEVEPPPGLAALDTLIDRHRTSGLEVAVTETGDRRRLTPGVDRAAFRILQESLTNAARHGTGTAAVALHFAGDALEIEVTNPVGTHVTARDGHGIVGMRERTGLLGGTLEAGARDGRFRVRARLPYGAAA